MNPGITTAHKQSESHHSSRYTSSQTGHSSDFPGEAYQRHHSKPAITPCQSARHAIWHRHVVQAWLYLRCNDIDVEWRRIYFLPPPFCNFPHTVIRGDLPAGWLINWNICQEKGRNKWDTRFPTTGGTSPHDKCNFIRMKVIFFSPFVVNYFLSMCLQCSMEDGRHLLNESWFLHGGTLLPWQRCFC